MASPLPHRYEATLGWSGKGGATVTAGARPPIVGGAPPEFDGLEQWWSPEHLLLSALNLCLMTTFEALARRQRVAVDSYHSRAEATLDKTGAGLGFTHLSLDVSLACAVEDVDKVRGTILKAKQQCLVANALSVPVFMKAEVSVWQPEEVAV
jgi:organic hydroperoxide reductase OsmC/OhrA